MKLTNRLEWNKEHGGAKMVIGNGELLCLFDGPNLAGLRLRDCGSQSLLKLQLSELPLFDAFVTTHPAANVIENSMFRKIAPGMESLYLTELAQLRMTDSLDGRYPMLIRTVALRIQKLNWKVEPAQGARLFYYEHIGTAYTPISCLMFLFPGNPDAGEEERRLYLYMLGKTEWDGAHRTLHIFAPGGTLIAGAGDPNKLLRHVLELGKEDRLSGLFFGSSEVLTGSADSRRWSRYYRRCPLTRRKLGNGTEERIFRIVAETLASLYSRRTRTGLYEISDTAIRTTVREQYHAMLFLHALGYRQEAEELFRAVIGCLNECGIVRELPLDEGAPRDTSGYQPYDSALMLLRLICLGAELTVDRDLLKVGAELVIRCCDCLRDGIAGLSVPYSGHEPELCERPFEVRFYGSAYATMAYVACIRRLVGLSDEGKLPLGDRLKFTSDLAGEMERSFCSGFVSGGEVLSDKKLERTRKMRYVYGICQFCDCLNKKPYEGWLLPFRTGSYICPDCMERKDELGRYRKQPAAARRNALPFLYSVLWDIPGLPEDEVRKKLYRLADSPGELSTEENTLLLHIMGKADADAASVCLKALTLRTERDQWRENTLDSRLFSALILAEYIGGERPVL